MCVCVCTAYGVTGYSLIHTHPEFTDGYVSDTQPLSFLAPDE